MPLSYYFIPLVTALIGWVTNVIAVKMLFHPREPISLGLFTLQGVVPRRKKALGKAIAKIAHEELFSVEELSSKLQEVDLGEDLGKMVDVRMDRFVEGVKESIPMAGMFLKGSLLDGLKEKARNEFSLLLPEIKEKVGKIVENDLDLHTHIEDKVSNFSVRKIESIVMKVAMNELKIIEVLGGALGLVIGLVQVALMVLLS
jgi:uncharacterized membrane protein YheB (UPF0754 family)